MNMKDHLLAALREQFEHWEGLLARLSEEQITMPQFEFGWSIKDVMAHLWGWQQISIARMEGGVQNREPEFPRWISVLGENWEDDADHTNALIYKNNRAKPWTDIYQNWRTGFLQFLESGHKISEQDLLDTERFPWLKGYSLAFILIASYDHHQEHFEKLSTLLGNKSNNF